MPNRVVDIEAVKEAFDSIKIVKGQIISLGTSDGAGNPNVAPVGSMRIVDDSTVHVLQGELGRTMKNLKANPRAVFSVVKRPKLKELLKDKEGNLGFRVYCDFTGTESCEEMLKEEIKNISHRLPFFLRRSFMKFAEENLKRILKFQITGVRKVSSES